MLLFRAFSVFRVDTLIPGSRIQFPEYHPIIPSLPWVFCPTLLLKGCERMHLFTFWFLNPDTEFWVSIKYYRYGIYSKTLVGQNTFSTSGFPNPDSGNLDIAHLTEYHHDIIINPRKERTSLILPACSAPASQIGTFDIQVPGSRSGFLGMFNQQNPAFTLTTWGLPVQQRNPSRFPHFSFLSRHQQGRIGS